MFTTTGCQPVTGAGVAGHLIGREEEAANSGSETSAPPAGKGRGMTALRALAMAAVMVVAAASGVSVHFAGVPVWMRALMPRVSRFPGVGHA